MLVLPSSRFFLLSPILQPLCCFQFFTSYSLVSLNFVRSFVRSFFECVPRDLVCWYSFFSYVFLPSRFLKLHFIFIACSVSANVVVLFFPPKRTCAFLSSNVLSSSVVLAFSFWLSSFLEISCLHCAVREQCCSSLFLVIRRYVSIF